MITITLLSHSCHLQSGILLNSHWSAADLHLPARRYQSRLRCTRPRSLQSGSTTRPSSCLPLSQPGVMAPKSIKVGSQMVIGTTANTPDGQDARFLQTRSTDVLSIDWTCRKYRGAVEINSCIGRLTKCWQIRFGPVAPVCTPMVIGDVSSQESH